MKFSKKYVITILIVIVVFLVPFLTIQIINAQPDRIYERAKKTCPTEIWLVEQDAVWTDVRGPFRKPYPANVQDITGERLIDFGCDQKTAEQKK